MARETARRRGVDVRQTTLDPEHWYPLALSSELARGGTRAVEWAGEPIVLFRTADGAVHALEDRCPHRQYPLSRGCVEGDGLRCGYHGWRFGTEGRCREIPSHPEASPARMRVRRYACREAYGMVFVHPGAGPEPRFPFFPGWEPRQRHFLHTSRRVECHPSFLFENLLDMTHQTLHRRLMGGVETETTGLEAGDGFVEARYRFHRATGRMRLGGRLALGSDVGDGTLAHVTVRTEYPYQLLEAWRPGSTVAALRLFSTYTPVGTEGRACNTIGVVAFQKPPVPGAARVLAPILRRFTEAIFREDREAVEAEQRAYDAHGNQNREVSAAVLRLQDLLVRHSPGGNESDAPAPRRRQPLLPTTPPPQPSP